MDVIYFVASSVDGFLAPPDGSLDWLAPFEASGDDHGYAAFYDSIDAVVLGSRTFEQALGFETWPYEGKPAVVMSSRTWPTADDRVVIDPRGPSAVLDGLRGHGHRRVWLVGGGELAGAFQRAWLITEWIVSVIPVVLGQGRGVLGAAGVPESLALVDTRTYPDGIVQLTYRRAGDA